jgi:hypothetical protein
VKYSFSSRRTDDEFITPLEAYWEVHCDPISDDYLPEDMGAEQLFWMWARMMPGKHPDGLIPISWYVVGEGICEAMPFQHRNLLDHDFRTYFTDPVKYGTNDEINWLKLPVVDKFWRKGWAEKGGFIQEATGWKPSILQPSVYLQSLIQAVG